MIAKRVTALVVMAMLSTVSPAIYQKGLEPRLGALDAKIEVNSFTYDAARSGKDILCYKAWITVKNPNPYEVILSQLDLDMFYATSYVRGYDGKTMERFKKIGSFNTTQEYTVPASMGVNVPESEWGAIASFDEKSHKIYADPLWGSVSPSSGGQWTDEPVFAYIYFSTQYEGNATEEAISKLLSEGQVTVDLQGDLVIGPLKIPFSLENVAMNLNIWGQIFTIVDVVGAYKKTPVNGPINQSNIYYVQAIIQNPSGNPFILKDYRFDLYEEGGTTPIALGIDSRFLASDDPGAPIYDPDVNQTLAGATFSTRVPLKDIAWGTFDNNTKIWADAPAVAVEFAKDVYEQYIILPLNFSTVQPDPQQATAKDNMAKFISRLLEDAIITDLELKGTATVALGTTSGTGTINGIEVNFGSPLDYETDPYRYLPATQRIALTETLLFQKSIESPQNIQDRMQLGTFTVTKIDVNAQTNLITLNATSTINFTNPYRIEMNFTEFGSAIDRDDNLGIGPEDRFSSGIERRVMQVWRGYRTMVNPTLLPAANTTVLTTNLTIGYNTDDFDTNSGLGQIYKDIGFWKDGSLQMFNLTNPFRVLGPNGVKLEDEDNAAPNWMELVDYLISHQVDPLMLLHEVNTTGETYTGVDAYQALGCGTFGTDKYTGSNPVVPAEDFPTVNGNLGGNPNFNKPYHTPFVFRNSGGHVQNNWSMYWNYESDIPGSYGWGLKWNTPALNKWVFAAAWGQSASSQFNNRGSGTGFWVPDWGYFLGAIWQNNSKFINANSPISMATDAGLYASDIRWRFYSGQSDYGWETPLAYNAPFGYWYDFSDLEKGNYLYMMGDASGTSDWAIGRQNFTLPAWMNNADIEVLNAKVSMSYRYPVGTVTGAPNVFLGISNQTLAQVADVARPTFQYGDLPQYTDETNVNLGYVNFAWQYGYPGTNDWVSVNHDVTAVVQRQLLLMGESRVNASKLEVAFGKTIDTAAGPIPVNFDDIFLSIEYKNTTKLSKLTPMELFSYLEENDQEEGNLWNMMDQLNFNATKFTAFLEGTLGHQVAPSTGINFIDFMKQSGAQPETIPELLQNNFTDIGGSEPVNFLQMLNQTRYRAAKPDRNIPYYPEVYTPYGARSYNKANWVVEDPMLASQVFTQKLLETLYLKADGTLLPGDIRGEELWNMLENLEVYLPWVCMYLVQHGWSKDDIFDLLEALNIGMETRQLLDHNYYADKATGSLSVEAAMKIKVDMHITVIGIGFHIGPFWLCNDPPLLARCKLNMGKTLMDSVTDMYFQLASQGITADYDDDGTVEASAIPLQVTSATIADLNSIAYSDFGSDWTEGEGAIDDARIVYPDSKIGIRSYTLAIWLAQQEAYSKFAPDAATFNHDWDPYAVPGAAGGLTAAGCQQLFQNMRQNVKFQGSTFIQTGGNPVSLFQFLDDAFFVDKSNVNYSSYTLMNMYNAKAIDFVEILTDYNRTAVGGAKFDALGNGICDEWKAPTSARYWEGTSSHYDSALAGFGYNFRDNRIFKQGSMPIGGGVQPYATSRANTIIWTDSPSFVRTTDDPGDAHAEGNIYLGDYATQDFIEKGAPPVVNLLDMFSWLSVITGSPDSETMMRWLTGQLGNEYYDCIGNGPVSTYDPLTINDGVQRGLGYDKTWGMFKNITMNATGMVNWLENVRALHPFRFFYLMNKSDQAMDPLQLLFYATSPNWVLEPDGSIAYVFHDALGTTNAIANENLWNLFNSTWWFQKDPYTVDPMFNLNGPTYATFPHLFYQHLRDLEVEGDVAFNLMVMMEALAVDPVSWVNRMQWNYNIKPLELFAIYNTLNYNWAITNRTGGKSRVRVNCTAGLQINGLNLNATIKSFNWLLEGRELTADYHLRNFLVAANLYRNSYVYHPYSGLP